MKTKIVNFLFWTLLPWLYGRPDLDLDRVLHSADVVISLYSGKENITDDYHLTHHLHNLTLMGHILPQDVIHELESVGYLIMDNHITKDPTTRNQRTESIGLDLTYDEGIFRFHYTLTGMHAVASNQYVIQMASAFNYVYDRMVNEMGFTRPPSDGFLPSGYDNGGSDAYDIYIRALPTGYYGYVQSEYYAQNTGNNENSPSVNEVNAFTSYMAMRNSYEGFPNSELESVQVTAAHEFFHAVQYGYDGWEMPWLLESTAVWMEEEIYDEINDCYQYMPSWFSSPQESLDAASGTHWYGSYIYFQYIIEHLGGYQTIKRIFDEGISTNSEHGDFSHKAIDDGLYDERSSFADALNKMAIANRILSSSPGFGAEQYSYEEAEDYPVNSPRILTTTSFSTGNPTTINSSSLQAFGSQYINIITDTPVQVEIINEGGPQSDLQFHSILKTSSGYYIVKSGHRINIDPGENYNWLTLIVVSQNNAGNDFDYRIELSDGIEEDNTLLPFTLEQPADGEYIESLTPTLIWNPTFSIQGSDQINYTVTFGINPELMDTIYIGQDTSFTLLNSLFDQTLYHWTVFAESISGHQLQNEKGVSRFFTLIEPLADKVLTISKPYPNPFPSINSSVNNTRIRIILQEKRKIDVRVINPKGQLVKILFSEELEPGFYDHIYWDGRMRNGKNAPSGVYFICVKSNSKVKWQKVTLLR